jgi:SAM-dependent methyltransferase
VITLDVRRLGVSTALERPSDAAKLPQLKSRLSGQSINLTNGIDDPKTAEHYSLQWGSTINYQDFARRNPDAMDSTPGRQMGWLDLFERIRARASAETTRVYDAACGFGGIMDELFRDPVPRHLLYVGADIHGALGDVTLPKNVRDDQIFLLRFDISAPLPVVEPFEFVICRASIHHTADPATTFSSLARVVAPQGHLAITAYAKKGRLRELNDDALRSLFANMSNDEAMRVAREFAALGKSLQSLSETVKIERDLEWLGISAGGYGVQQLIYDCILKCWYNQKFGDELSSLINFDWYHPTFAYRYERVALREWFLKAGLKVEREMSTKAQHYLEGVRV